MIIMSTLTELPEGDIKKKANDLMGQISTKWKSLSEEERKSQTSDTLVALREMREMRDFAPHNVPISSFHDVRVTLQKIDDEVSISQ